MIKRLPKLRGRGVNSNKSIQTKAVVIHVADLAAFKSGEMVTPMTLVDKGILKTFGGKCPRVKILSSGDKAKAASVTVRGCEVSTGAKAEIEKAGGKIEA
jgi:ribosomal protein L15